MRRLKINGHAKGQRGNEGDLVGRINAFNIKRGIGLGIAQGLSLRQSLLKRKRLVAHLGENKVGGAINNARHPFNAICC